ncbi:MAG: hypothetical protein ACRCR9_06765 [Chitinophagaceae bacterium]
MPIIQCVTLVYFVLQNLLQSHEIRFGDAFEHIIEAYLKLKGGEILPKQLIVDKKKVLSIDQLFNLKNTIYFIEQKVRDDHDSTKKRGQIDNFEKNLIIYLINILIKNYWNNVFYRC